MKPLCKDQLVAKDTVPPKEIRTYSRLHDEDWRMKDEGW